MVVGAASTTSVMSLDDRAGPLVISRFSSHCSPASAAGGKTLSGDMGCLEALPEVNAGVVPSTLSATELLQRYASGERNFAQARLVGASLDGADLRDVDLAGANLTGASFRSARLERANLTGTIGLLPSQLAGTNLSGARLPSSIGEFADLKRARELGDSAQKLFLGILGGCAYTVLTVATTTDPQIMMVSTPTELPIIKTPIPTVGFFWVAPLLLAALFVYFHLYLQRLWETLAGLPAILPDGAAVDVRVDPWLINALIRRQAPRLRESDAARVPWLRLQNAGWRAAAWWIGPVTLLPLWWRYLTRHDWIATGVHIGLIGLLLVSALEFRWLTDVTLRGEGRDGLSRRPIWHARTLQLGAWAAISMGLLFVVSYAAIEGAMIRADLYQAEAWPKPPDWTGTEQQVASAKEVDFSRRDFRRAGLASSFLVKANLSDAQLQGAYLGGAQLQGANLSDAQLQGAYLVNAQLQQALLLKAQLQQAALFDAQLQGAILIDAQLQGALLGRAQLQGANLIGAQMQGAYLGRAQLQGAILAAAQLQDAILSEADLNGANLNETNLDGANLEGANLENVRCLSSEQLAGVRTDSTTKLPVLLPTPCG
jgi:uncharacterized protein YjbI with pentapeptide repeats